MRIVSVEQNTPEWFEARRGIPSASNFEKLITPATRKPSKSAEGYMHALLAEWVIGESVSTTPSTMMLRGTEMEQEAADWYGLETGVIPEKVGFCLLDDGTAGASPDRLVGDDGCLECKVPAAGTHVGYLLNPDSLVADYAMQVQGQLYVTGRSWCSLLAYNPVLPPVLRRVDRDEELIAALAAAIRDFSGKLNAGKARLIALGCTPAALAEVAAEGEF